ncbi:MAG: prepilin peptidase [Candidatus Eremiobacteraeota bacterium]|nr:prepilin peptidase [Candidatus Eremiobacteraeota bacterium]
MITDLRSRRIPNVLTLSLIAFAPFMALARGGIAGAVGDVLLIAVLIAFGLVVHRGGWLGGGDIKLACGIAAVIGYPSCIGFLLLSGICGGVLALVWALAHGRASQLRAQLQGAAIAALTRSGTVPPVALSTQDARIPYALAFSAGLACSMLFEIGFPAMRFWQ